MKKIIIDDILIIKMCCFTVKQFKKSSVSDVDYYGHIDGDVNLIVDILPLSSPDHYKTVGDTGSGIVYREDSSTDSTDGLEANGGSNVFIRKSNRKKNIQPSLCPKTHCPAPFQFSIG